MQDQIMDRCDERNGTDERDVEVRGEEEIDPGASDERRKFQLFGEGIVRGVSSE